MAKKLVLILLVFGVVSCQFKKDGADEVREPRPLNSVKLTSIVEPSEEMFFYNVRLSWSGMKENCVPIINRRYSEDAQSEGLTLGKGISTADDLGVIHNQKIMYSISCQLGDQVHWLETIEVQTPMDHVVKDLLSISKENLRSIFLREGNGTVVGRFGRLSFIDGSIIMIYDNTVVIYADEINFGPGGRIMTFEKGSEATSGNGRSGGTIEIIAKKGAGNVKLLLHGERGGVGTDGGPYPEDVRGQTGENGSPAVYVNDGPAKGFGDHKYWDRKCSKNPTDGQQGSIGLTGMTGTKGFRGGNTGSAKIFVAEGAFGYHIDSLPGLGGLGGDGGPGSNGGEGGEPGFQDVSGKLRYQPDFMDLRGSLGNVIPCKFAKKGAVGPVGKPGERGPPGDSGSVLPNEIWDSVAKKWSNVN